LNQNLLLEYIQANLRWLIMKYLTRLVRCHYCNLLAFVPRNQALQLERLKWSLKHAYEKVERYRKKFDDIGAHPDDLKITG
jgi:phenylacetate-CoA ligase (EC 6.2.1.30)